MKKSFILQEQLKLALEWQLKMMEEVRKEQSGWHVGEYFYATDLERRLRAAACEIADNREYGFYQNYGGGVRIGGLGGLSLLDHCRRFLRSKVLDGTLRADNPKQDGTCSGLRFRPADRDLTEAEKRTQAVPREERNRWIRHFDPNKVDPRSGTPICQQNKPPKRAFYRRSNPIYCTDKPENVTCKLCRKMMAKLPHPLAPELRADANPLIVADWLEERGLQPDWIAEVRQNHHKKLQEV